MQDFTCFRDQTIEFVPGVNVFVGENGTGKTHAMKVLYAAQQEKSATRARSIYAELQKLFQIGDLTSLRRKTGDEASGVRLSGRLGEHDWEAEIHTDGRLLLAEAS